ncbi:CDP-glucose 4,6-dehydratase [Polaromonas sp. AER18D-145]|uniref:CDP-glucose 4,6-dehydratase n=1 Tax=Polaromonas sp. AER18D-145 TaxID=1977060 RepID=UPI000BBB6FEB|nr:CDP-glucose 4,6-dehydratase [Polaromonas sp. AER18D-145]
MSQFAEIYRGRRVLVTGHTGFKGSWLALWLTHIGAEVAGYSVDVPTNPSNFELLGLEKRLRHYVGDIRDRVRLAEVVDEFRPELVFHMAAQALVRRSYADPVTTFETNTMGMVNVLECVRTRPWIQVAVLITSDKAYRNDEWCWGYRETDALGGHDPYSGSKSCADLIAHSYYHSFLRNSPTRIAITRAGNVIGGGDWADDRIVPDCIRAWSQGESVDVRSPQATRPWQHVLEPLSGYLWLGARLWQQADGLNGEAFNFGPDAHVNQTVEKLLEAMAARWPEVRWQVPEGFEQVGHEAMLLKLSCDKVLFHLAWRAVLQFPETVAFTVDWYRVWREGHENLQSYTLGQIDAYCQLAQARGATWVDA